MKDFNLVNISSISVKWEKSEIFSNRSGIWTICLFLSFGICIIHVLPLKTVYLRSFIHFYEQNWHPFDTTSSLCCFKCLFIHKLIRYLDPKVTKSYLGLCKIICEYYTRGGIHRACWPNFKLKENFTAKIYSIFLL